MRIITERLLPDLGAADELEVFLGSLGGLTHHDGWAVYYQGGRLVVEYNSKHEIREVRVADDYPEPLIDKLAGEVREALSHSGRDVAQRYLHSHYCVDGFYRYRDSFQILPSPPDAPQPDFLHAKHAFLLEYSFPRSPHNAVNRYRASRRFSDISLLLHSLLHAIHLPDRSTTHAWVVTPDPEWQSRYLQLGYFGGQQYPPKEADGFSATGGLPKLELVDAQGYYTEWGVNSGNPMTLPDSIEDSVTAFESLDEETRATFCRAAFWSHVSSRVWAVSESASFAALVNAVEVFLPDPDDRCALCSRPTSSDRCEGCNQPKSGPTRQFREFVDQYSPGVSAKDRGKLYARRSSLVHGSTLLPGDMSGLGFGISPRDAEAWSERQLLSQIVQFVFVNWLVARS